MEPSRLLCVDTGVELARVVSAYRVGLACWPGGARHGARLELHVTFYTLQALPGGPESSGDSLSLVRQSRGAYGPDRAIILSRMNTLGRLPGIRKTTIHIIIEIDFSGEAAGLR